MRLDAAIAGAAIAAFARGISGAQVTFTSEEALAAALSPEPCVYFANHTSNADFVLVWSALPPWKRRLTRPVAAKDYWEAGRLRRYATARVFRALLVERPPGARGETPNPDPEAEELAALERRQRAVSGMLSSLDAGDSLILFPEGNRGDGRELLRFRSGLYQVADERPGVPLIPVLLENLNRVMPKGEVVPIPFLSRLVFGDPQHLRPDEERRDFLDRMRTELGSLSSIELDALDALEPDDVDPRQNGHQA